MPYGAGNRMPVLGRDGELFDSQVAAAKHYGVTKRVINYHLQRYGHLENLGRPKPPPFTPDASKGLHLFGHVWSSRTQACKDLHISKHTLYRHLKAIRKGGDEASDAWAKLRAYVYAFENPASDAAYAHRKRHRSRSAAGKRGASKETKHERIHREQGDHRPGSRDAADRGRDNVEGGRKRMGQAHVADEHRGRQPAV